MMSLAEYKAENPEAYVQNGAALEHDMEHDEFSGFERCNECGGYENDVDDVCPDSNEALDDWVDWEDYTEDPVSGWPNHTMTAYVAANS